MATFTCAKIEVSTNEGVGWTDISEEAGAVSRTGGEKDVSGFKTFGLCVPVQTTGKPGLITVNVRARYVEATLLDTLYTQYKSCCSGILDVRWTPLGGNAGDYRYTTVSGFLVSDPSPSVVADSSDTALVEFTVSCVAVNQDTV